MTFPANMSHVMRKPVFAICEQQMRRSACASAAVWSAPFYSLLRWYNICSFYMQNLKALASLCSRFESYLVGNPDDRFSHDVAHTLYPKFGLQVQRHMSRDMTKPTKWVCAQRRLRSAWASAQSDQSLCLRSVGSLGPKLSSCGQRRLWSDWADALADLGLRWAHSHIVGFIVSRLISYKEHVSSNKLWLIYN